jgi:hypothetical protein
MKEVIEVATKAKTAIWDVFEVMNPGDTICQMNSIVLAPVN